MGVVYRVGGMYGTEYFNTIAAARRHKPNDEEPEEFVRLTAADECNRLNALVDETETHLNRVRYLLAELLEATYQDDAITSTAWINAQKYLADNPLPPATSAEREGGRSYGI